MARPIRIACYYRHSRVERTFKTSVVHRHFPTRAIRGVGNICFTRATIHLDAKMNVAARGHDNMLLARLTCRRDKH